MNNTPCLDPQYAFLNFHTFSSCFYSLGNVTDDASAASLPFNSPFGQVIHECIVGYCNATADCMRLEEYDKGGYGLQLFPNIGFRAEACRGTHGLPLEPNADIAGPGALISYVMQASMVLYIWLVVRVLDYLPATCNFLTGLFDKANSSKAYRNRIRSQLLEKTTKHRLIARFVLVEFQETQCYFMIAIQLASILALSRAPDMFDASNIFQLVRDILTTRCVSLGANVPITFGLWLLYKLDMESWYTLFCSSITVLLSIATFSMSSHWNLKPDSLALSENKVFECGGQPPPLIWCAFEDNYKYGKSTVEVTIPHAVSLACFVLLALVQVSPWKRHANKKFSRTHLWGVTLRGLSIFIELGLVTMVILYPLIVLGLGILDTPAMVDFSGWNFGQVIAVSIWVPVILKYFYWTIFGVESYSATRIPLPYKITNTEIDSEHLPLPMDILHEKSYSFNPTITELRPMKRTTTSRTM